MSHEDSKNTSNTIRKVSKSAGYCIRYIRLLLQISGDTGKMERSSVMNNTMVT